MTIDSEPLYSIAIFGGTFDPIHYGHLGTSINIQGTFHFDSYRFLPCNIPALKKEAAASNEQRIHMLELALAELDLKFRFSIDLREIQRPGPSYMVDTLRTIRAEHPAAAITLILGFDAYQSLPHWHQWQQINKFAHLLVIHRDSYTINQNMLSLENANSSPERMQQERQQQLKTHTAGTVCQFNAGTFKISSTEIRNALHKQQDISTKIPAVVYDYIKEQGLYQ